MGPQLRLPLSNTGRAGRKLPKIHVATGERLNELPVFKANDLIQMHVKSGRMMDARHVFDNMPRRDLVSWNIIILGYAKHEEGVRALKLFARMHQDGVQPNDRTFVGALKACISLTVMEEGIQTHGRFQKRGSLTKGRAIHLSVVKSGFDSDIFVGTTLVNMYVKCGSIEDAQIVFDRLPHRDVVTWTNMILGYAEQEYSRRALELYVLMHQEGVKSNAHTFVGALKACSSLAAQDKGKKADRKCVTLENLTKGRAIHFQVVRSGCESNVFVGTTLVNMYAKCGSMENAQSVFDELRHPGGAMWTNMILGYAEQGDGTSALELYTQMHQEGLQLSSRTFVGALKACSSQAALEEGKQVDRSIVNTGCLAKGRAIHYQIVKSGFESDVFVGTTLVDMYVKCGNMVDAQYVFDAMHHRNVVAWTTIILGYTNQNCSTQALQLYAQMHQDGVSTDDRIFVGALKACSNMGALDEGKQGYGNSAKIECLAKGRAIHSHVLKGGFESDIFVGNTLMNMYVKCGSMKDAQNVFYNLPHCDAVMWATMLLGYAELENCEVTLELYAQMQQKGVQFNAQICAGALHACSSLATQKEGEEVDSADSKIGCLEKGRAIHSQAIKSGFAADTVVGNTLVNMYAKCGSMEDAGCVFDALPYRDVVTWTTMIMGYAEQEDNALALKMYAWMYQEGITADHRTFACALKACSSLAALEEGKHIDRQFMEIGWLMKGRAIHFQVVKNGFESDLFVGTTLVNMYAKFGSIKDAKCVFDELPHRDVTTWTSMILAYSGQEDCALALDMYAKMHQEGIRADHRTFACVLKACSSLAALEEEMQVGEKPGKMRCLLEGRAIHFQIVKSGLESEVILGNNLVNMYAKCWSMEEARSVFDTLPHCDANTWTTMILAYAEQGENKEAFRLYSQMQEQDLSPSTTTFVAILKACGNIGALQTVKELHSQVSRAGLETLVIMTTSLIYLYAKCGSMADAQQLFDALPTRDVVPWSALMAGYACQGESELVFTLFERMTQEGLQPDKVTFVSVLTVCNHVGLLDKGQKYFQAMSKQYGIMPSIEHYACIVDLLGRAGQVDEAVAMVERMPFQPNVGIWLTMLSACRMLKNVDVGRHAFEKLVALDKKIPAAYVLMANIYGDVHIQDYLDKIQVMRER